MAKAAAMFLIGLVLVAAVLLRPVPSVQSTSTGRLKFSRTGALAKLRTPASAIEIVASRSLVATAAVAPTVSANPAPAQRPGRLSRAFVTPPARRPVPSVPPAAPFDPFSSRQALFRVGQASYISV